MLTIEDLQKMRPFLNLSRLAEQAGINHNTLLGKVSRGTELSVKESESIRMALAGVGLQFGKLRGTAAE